MRVGIRTNPQYSLADYALPFFAGLTAGLAAYHSGAGVVGGILVGFFAGAVMLALGQVAFVAVRSPFIRAAIALLFAAPGAVAGYHATLGVAHIGGSSETWRVTAHPPGPTPGFLFVRVGSRTACAARPISATDSPMTLFSAREHLASYDMREGLLLDQLLIIA